MKNPIVECIQYLEMVSFNHLSKIIFKYTHVIQIQSIFVAINSINVLTIKWIINRGHNISDHVTDRSNSGNISNTYYYYFRSFDNIALLEDSKSFHSSNLTSKLYTNENGRCRRFRRRNSTWHL